MSLIKLHRKAGVLTILHTRKLRPRKRKHLAQRHKATEFLSQNSNAGPTVYNSLSAPGYFPGAPSSPHQSTCWIQSSNSLIINKAHDPTGRTKILSLKLLGDYLHVLIYIKVQMSKSINFSVKGSLGRNKGPTVRLAHVCSAYSRSLPHPQWRLGLGWVHQYPIFLPQQLAHGLEQCPTDWSHTLNMAAWVP